MTRGVRSMLALLGGAAAWLCLCGASLATHQAVRAGNAALAGGDPAAAGERYQEALAADPDNPALIYNLGTARLAAGDPAAAGLLRDALERAEADPKGAPVAGRAAFNLGNALLNQADAAPDNPDAGIAALEGAVDAFRKAVARAPDDADARRNLQLAATRLRDLREQSRSGSRQEKQDGQQGQDEQSGQDGKSGQDGQDGRKQPDSPARGGGQDGERGAAGPEADPRQRGAGDGGETRDENRPGPPDPGRAMAGGTGAAPDGTAEGVAEGQATALSADEVERLLGSLSRGQAATLREAVRRAMGDGREQTVEKDW